MKIRRVHDFGRLEALEVGWSPVGRPLMTAFCYRIGPVMVDTGIRHTEREVTAWAEGAHPEMVLLTHHHEDHSGNCAALRRRFNLPVYAHPQTVAAVKGGFRIRPYQHLIWGRCRPFEAFPLPGEMHVGRWRFIPVHTPGHSQDHTVYWVPEEGWLFSGDLYLADRIKFFRADERVDQQIRSLRRVLELEFESLWCGHRPRPRQGKRHLAAKLDFLEDVYGNVARLWDKGWSRREIMTALGLREAWAIRGLTLGNASMRNLIDSVIASRLSCSTPKLKTSRQAAW